jgi:hypothetical protein
MGPAIEIEEDAMERQRFLGIADDWDVEDILHANIVKDDGERFADVYRLDEADWEAVSLKLARGIKDSNRAADSLQSRVIELEDLLDAQATQIEDLKSEISFQKGLVEGRDRAIKNYELTVDRKSTENFQYFNTIESLYLAIAALGEKIHDLNEEAKK